MSRCSGGLQNASAEGAPSLTASQALLPSVASAHPLRRTASLSSAERSSAHRSWQITLRERLGTPGAAPGRDELPSLYNRPSITSAMRPVSGASRSCPPSTAGPSASIVAWFAQFRCESCGRIPLSLDAKFCAACGHSLEIKVPTELQAQVQAAQAQTAAVGSQAGKTKPLEEKQNSILQERQNGNSFREGDPLPRQRQDRVSKRGAVQRAAMAQLLAKRGYTDGGQGQARPPRQPGGKDWAARESQVALWLDNIKPRVSAKIMS